MDHASPGSSFTVGKELVESIFGMPRPAWFGYSFVGFAGVQKMSSSAGGVPTAADALRILEAPILRWLYVRRNPKQAFNIDFGAEVVRLYDEWDALGRKAADPAKRDAQVLACERASATSAAGALPTPPVRRAVPAAVLGRRRHRRRAELISRTVGTSATRTLGGDLEPRLSQGATWIREFVARVGPHHGRAPARRRTAGRAVRGRGALARPAARPAARTTSSSSRSTALIYGVPKLARGLGLDDPPTDEVKADQKAFFRLLYNLLVAADRGPRLPTLFLALGAGRGPVAARQPPSSAVVRRRAGVAQERRAALPLVGLPDARAADGAGGRGSSGSRGWARAPTAPGRGPSSRCGGAGRASGGSRPVRRRRRSRRRRLLLSAAPPAPPRRGARPGGGVRRPPARLPPRALPLQGRRAGGSAADRPSGPGGSGSRSTRLVPRVAPGSSASGASGSGAGAPAR